MARLCPIAVPAALSLALALVAGCAAPSERAAGGRQVLYVANSLDDTITQLDGATGRVAGPLLPAGTAPWQIALGPPGSLFVATVSPFVGHLTHVVRDGASWRARPMAVGTDARAPLLAGDGGRYVAVVYRGWAGWPNGLVCRLALIDVLVGVPERSTMVCGPRESVTALALDGGPGGPVAYLGVAESGFPGARAGRIEAVEAATGATVARLPLAGAPAHVLLAPAPGRVGVRLYCAEAMSWPEDGSPGAPGGHWGRLLGLHPVTLDVESEHWLRARPVAIAVAPEGDQLYALDESGREVVELHLATGAERRLPLPGFGLSLVVTAEHVYVSGPRGSAVWALDRRHGRPVRTLPVGRGPAALALSRID